MKFLLFYFLIGVSLEHGFCGFGLRDINKIKTVPLKPGEDPGNPLIITPYLEQGRIDEARNLSVVPEEHFLGIKSYSGYFTVNKDHNSNSFFWFFPARDVDYKDAPVLLWLQGGPGVTSLLALFTENGPFKMIDETTIELSETSWNFNYSVIYIDNPVGTGFSFTQGRWCKTEEEVGEDLYTALIQFFRLFPELQKNDFFITGESYAGKYVPAISYTIHKNNADADLKINLKGLTIGNGLCDPINQLNYGDYLYQIGLIDSKASELMKELETEVISLVQENEYMKGFEVYDTILNGDLTKYPTAFKNATGFDGYYNFLNPSASLDSGYSIFVQQSNIRKALHVGNMSFVTDDEVEVSLREDFLKSVAPWISELLNHYRVLIYNGQLDIIVAYPLTVNFLRNLNFSSATDYEVAERNEWLVDGEIAGYVKVAGNLTEVLVRNAGHLVPSEQAIWALDLINRFVRNIPLH